MRVSVSSFASTRSRFSTSSDVLNESVHGGLRFFLDEDLLSAGFLVAFTTGLDLSRRFKEDPARAAEDRLLVTGALGLPPRSLVFAEQVHKDRVAVVKESDIGAGSIPSKPPLAESDALVTAQEGIPLVILTADCVPIALVDQDAGVCAAVHAGWRGTLAEIVAGAVQAMVRLGARPARIQAWIGPAIGPCCYEVGSELFTRFSERFVVPPPTGDDERLDLREINEGTLRDSGVLPENIESLGLCTACEDDTFYSWRARRDAGRQGLIVARLR